MCVTREHLDAETGVTLDRVVWLDGADNPLHALHHCSKIDFGVGVAEPQLLGLAQFSGEFSRSQQGFRRHAASVQAVATQLVFLDQADLSFYRRCNISTN